jgi:hypothetical protein
MTNPPLQAPRIDEMSWVGRQAEAIQDETRYLDIEGAIRSSKTTIGLRKVIKSLVRYPGIRWLVCRWVEEDASALLRPLIAKAFADMGILAPWIPDEHRYHLPNGSWLYVRGLRPSQDTSRFAKFRGMTLAGVMVDQAEEIPEDFFLELKGRLSQPGYPAQMILTPNPAGDDHWLSLHFPDVEAGAPENPNHKLIQLSIYDNAHNLEPEYVAQLERDYPDGHPMRRRLLFGKRGLSVSGKPVYGGYYRRADHLRDVDLLMDVPLIEAIDFGHHHPCVVWLQFPPWGGLHVLGGLMGEDLFIEDFAPLILQTRAEWFQGAMTVHQCCDPAGSHANSQGTRLSGVGVLQDHGLAPTWVPSSNAPEVRSMAVQTVAGYMRRRTLRGGEAFAVDRTHWRVVSARDARYAAFFTDALEAGYVWDARTRRTSGGKAIQVPLKDGYYEHGQNCLEYGVLNYGPARPTTAAIDRTQAAVDASRARRDVDPYDVRRRPTTIGGRAGW